MSNKHNLPIQKGSTVYRVSTGEPHTVRSTRVGASRFGLGQTATVVLKEGGWEFSMTRSAVDAPWELTVGARLDWALKQDATLAAKWAETLAKRETKQRADDAVMEQRRALRLKHRDTLNALPKVETTRRDGKPGIKLTWTVLEGGSNSQDVPPVLVQRTNEAQVSVYKLDRRLINENGTFDYNDQLTGVNWSAMGTQSVEVARAYANAILEAADLAERANRRALKASKRTTTK